MGGDGCAGREKKPVCFHLCIFSQRGGLDDAYNCYSAGACFGDSRGRLQVPRRKKARAAGAWRSLYNAWARLSGLAVSSDRNGRYVLVLFADLVR